MIAHAFSMCHIRCARCECVLALAPGLWARDGKEKTHRDIAELVVGAAGSDAAGFHRPVGERKSA